MNARALVFTVNLALAATARVGTAADAPGELTPVQEFLCQPRLPEGQFHDLPGDSWETPNLADSPGPEDRSALQRLRAAVDQWIVDPDDHRRLPDPNAAPLDGATRDATPTNDPAK